MSCLSLAETPNFFQLEPVPRRESGAEGDDHPVGRIGARPGRDGIEVGRKLVRELLVAANPEKFRFRFISGHRRIRRLQEQAVPHGSGGLKMLTFLL